MRKSTMKAVGIMALTFGLVAFPAMAADPASKPTTQPTTKHEMKHVDPCTMTIKAEVNKEAPNTTTFTLSPEHKDATYNWTIDAGAIADGQGTPSLLIDNPPPGTEVTASVDALDRPGCPAKTNHASVTIKIPKLK